MSQHRAAAYEAAGVSIKNANSLVEQLKAISALTPHHGVISGIGGFGGIFKPDLSQIASPLLVASTDGVGTKVKLAIAFNRHATIGIDLVAMSANDILVQGASSLFFLDYFACSRLDVNTCATVVSGIAEGCRQAGCALLGGETAEMPGIYQSGEYDLAGFCVGIVDKGRLIDGSNIQEGDSIIGIESSGIHSNGYSLVRKILEKTGLKADSPFPDLPDQSVADILLKPTIIYVDVVKPLLQDAKIKGMAHITGGGFYDNIPRILPFQMEARINFGSWKIPAVFEWLKREAKLTWPEMLQIFNCGIGYILVLPSSQANETIERIQAHNLKAWEIGVIEKRQHSEDGWSEQIIIDNIKN